MSELTADERDELSALAEINDAIKRPSFIMRFHWHESGYASLVRRGLVKWGHAPKGFDNKRFAGTTITDKGRRAIQEADDGHS